MRQRGQIEAEREGPEGSEKSEGRGFARDTLLPILAVLAILVPLRSAIADWNDVPSGSMRPTILEGDRIWVNKLAYGLRVPLTMAWITHWDEPTRGDVVTLASPDDGIRLVKRIVGLPGDRIAMAANRLTINGEPVVYDRVDRVHDTPRAPDPTADPMAPLIQTERLGGRLHAVTVIPALAGLGDSFDEFIVPEGQYFFLGDNRDQSNDSRFIGTVALEGIYGRVSFIALSVDPERYYRPRIERWLRPLDIEFERPL
jgi:signal peptidase I